MDPWRQQILADIGIPTWTRRELLPAPGIAGLAAQAAPEVAAVTAGNPSAQGSSKLGAPPTSAPPSRPQGRARDAAAENALAALSQSLDSGPTRGRRASPSTAPTAPAFVQPGSQAQVHPVKHPEVACLWAGDAVLFCPPSELVGQVRLAKDILASAANNWTQAVEQLVFHWAELQASGFDPAEADRALLAFAEKRIEVCAARWVLSTPTLQPLLAELALPSGARLLGLAELANLAREARLKQQLWQALGQSPKAPANDG